jgi:IS30 family transposase
METSYCHLSLSERIDLFRLHSQGESLRSIANKLGRSPATLSRELRRNSRATKLWTGGYRPERAQQLAERRRHWDGRFKLARQPALRAFVYRQLQAGWSPEQIAGFLRRCARHGVVSHEAIYRFVYHRSAQKDYWHRLLPRHQSRRGRLGQRGGSPVEHIRERVPIQARPASVNRRRRPGHWEGDLMLFARYGQALLVSHERYSRLLLVERQPDKTSRRVLRHWQRQFAALPPALRRSLTLDNGTEFALHYRLRPTLGMATYFCDPHAPWQKGGIENAIGRLRRRLPRKTDLAKLTRTQLDTLVAAYNHTPRKCLGFCMPAEVFCRHLQLLHFKRECTYPLSRV